MSLTADRQLTKPDSAQTGMVRELDSLDRLPTARTYQGDRPAGPRGQRRRQPEHQGRRFQSKQVPHRRPGRDRPGHQHVRPEPDLRFHPVGRHHHRRHGRRVQRPRRRHQRRSPGAAATTSASVASFYANHSRAVRQRQLRSQPVGGQTAVQRDAGRPDRDLSGLDRGRRADPEAPAVVRRHLRVRLHQVFAGQGGAAGRSPVRHPAPGSAVHRPSGTPEAVGGPDRLSSGSGCPPTPIRRPSRTPPAATPGWASPRTDSDRAAVFGVVGWEWRASENLIPSIQVGFLKSFLDIGPMGWYGSFDATGCKQFDPINCTYDPQPPPAHQHRRQHRLAPGQLETGRQPLPGASRPERAHPRDPGRHPHAEAGIAGPVHAPQLGLSDPRRQHLFRRLTDRAAPGRGAVRPHEPGAQLLPAHGRHAASRPWSRATAWAPTSRTAGGRRCSG